MTDHCCHPVGGHSGEGFSFFIRFYCTARGAGPIPAKIFKAFSTPSVGSRVLRPRFTFPSEWGRDYGRNTTRHPLTRPSAARRRCFAAAELDDHERTAYLESMCAGGSALDPRFARLHKSLGHGVDEFIQAPAD